MASFTDGATNVRCPVSQQKAYIEAERSYMKIPHPPMEPLAIEFMGDIIIETDEEAGARPTIVIGELIRMGSERSSLQGFIIPGLYESESEGIKSVLRLKPDYTYTQTVYTSHKDQTETGGTWYRTAVLEMVTVNEADPLLWHSFKIVPIQSSIYTSSDGDDRIYKKVYL